MAEAEAKPARPCPVCGKPAQEHVRPFCSRRCADVDLHRWLSGTYRVPAVEQEDDSERATDDKGQTTDEE
jgi:uncharacterized protein